jgi:CubicO group peptidase (beta-lactamase class C family)
MPAREKNRPLSATRRGDARKSIAAIALLSCVVLSGGCSRTSTPATEAAPLPVSVAKAPFTPEQVSRFHEKWQWQDVLKTGDVSLYLFLHFSEFYPIVVVHRAEPMVPLKTALDAEIGRTRGGLAPAEMSLDEYLDSPSSRAQGMIVVRHGKIAFEKYPGMREDDYHITMSVAKTMPSLIISLLEEEGKINVENTIGSYIPSFTDTAWNSVKVIDVLNMVSGLDVVETKESHDDPTSSFGRYLRASLNVPSPNGKVEKSVDVIRRVKKIREPGLALEYSSMNTQVLVLLAEAVENRPWAEIFQDRVWSRMNAEGDVQIFITSDGNAFACGLVSMRLRDLARFGMLYTPSWGRASREQVVSADTIKQIQTGVSPNRKPPGSTVAENFSRQWDWVFFNGDFFKGGLHSQGLYVSPSTDLVIAWFSTAKSTDLHKYARAIAKKFAEGD